ncbi:MAG: biotin synthase BioB [Candidatus Riflebacteria bacterium]|nr:biotin synthase BioB [Candidatus Riflebacteria bacterium]
MKGIVSIIKLTKEYLEMYELPLAELVVMADRVRRENKANYLDICTICNAKSGSCTEDCKFCAQSAHFLTDAPRYPLLGKGEIVAAARKASEVGSKRFGIVTSGRELSNEELACIIEVVEEIKNEVGIEICASLGCLDFEQFTALKDAGLTRYHHNLETSQKYFTKIVTSHTFEDRIHTIQAAFKAGLSVCSGGIIGMGESREDRISMAFTLKDLNVDCVPINVLVPIPGTPLANEFPIHVSEVLKTVSIFRLIFGNKTIKIAAGREVVLKDFQGMAFLAGANGMLMGGYLTTRGRSVTEDQAMIKEIIYAWNDSKNF